MDRGPESPDACLLCNMGTTTVKVGFLWAVSMMFQGGVGWGGAHFLLIPTSQPWLWRSEVYEGLRYTKGPLHLSLGVSLRSLGEHLGVFPCSHSLILSVASLLSPE